MNNFLKYPLTDNKNKIIKFEDIKAIKLGGFVNQSSALAHLYRNIGTKTYEQINGTNFEALKDELVPLIIDFDNDFAEPEPVIRFIIDHNNTYEFSDNVNSNYYFNIENKIVMVVEGVCYSPYLSYGVGHLESIIPESIILRSGEELEFVIYGTFVFYKNDNTEILVSTEASTTHANLYFNVIAASEQENIISININSRRMSIYNNYDRFIISSEEEYNYPEGEEEEEGA